MTEKYLFHQTGVVEEMFLPGKAIVTFQLHGQVQRVLLWVKCFVHQVGLGGREGLLCVYIYLLYSPTIL